MLQVGSIEKEEALSALTVKCKPGSPFVHYLAVKAHKYGQHEAHKPPTVFVSGLPYGADEEYVTKLFSVFGDVEQAVMHRSKRSVMVVFTEEAAKRAALNAASRGQMVECLLAGPQEDSEPTGLKAWVAEHKAQRPGNDVLQAQLDAWMASWEEAQERAAKERQSAMAEDGWTVVVRAKGRKRTREEDGMTIQTGGVAAAGAGEGKEGKRSKPVDDFYRFQRRDKQRSDLMDLRAKFEADKKRISELRSQRNFKPY